MPNDLWFIWTYFHLKCVDESQDSEMEQDVEGMDITQEKVTDPEKVPEIGDSNTDSNFPRASETSVLEDVTMETSAMESSAVDMSVASETDANMSKESVLHT